MSADQATPEQREEWSFVHAQGRNVVRSREMAEREAAATQERYKDNYHYRDFVVRVQRRFVTNWEDPPDLSGDAS
jgi:hypothetical protein